MDNRGNQAPVMRVGPRERACYVKAITGAELAVNAEPYVPLDNIIGAPIRQPNGKWGHLTRLILRVTGTVDTNAAMGAAVPVSLLAGSVQNVRVRAAGKDLTVGQPDGEDMNQAAAQLYRGQPTPASTPAATLTDATAAGVAFQVYVIIPFASTIKDRFMRESDGAIPVAAFNREIDAEHGLRFRFAPDGGAAGAGAGSFKGVIGVTLRSITACDVWAIYRSDGDLNVALPGYRFYNESQQAFDLEPVGGLRGANMFVAAFDPPVAATGIRDHASYANVSARFGDDQLYSGRSAAEIADMSNLIDPDGPAGGVVVGRSAPEILPFYARRAAISMGEEARGPLTLNIGTRTPNFTRIMQICRQEYDSDAAKRIAATAGGASMFAGRQTVAEVSSTGLAAVIDQKLKRQ